MVSVFARPGHALDQEVAAREQANEHALEHLFLTRDHAPDLEQRLLELAAHVVCHVVLLARGSRLSEGPKHALRT